MDLQPKQLAVQSESESEEQMAQELLQSQPSEPSPKKIRPRNNNVCSNKICSLYKHTKYNQNNQNNVQNLCPQCIKQYKKQLYCFYCKQIYFQSTDDGKEWIMCDECERWVHTECADFLAIGPILNFTCLRCKKIDVNPISNQNGVSSRRNSQNRTTIGAKVPERRKTQECMLNNFGFYWQLSPQQLAEDVDKLKQFMK